LWVASQEIKRDVFMSAAAEAQVHGIE